MHAQLDCGSEVSCIMMEHVHATNIVCSIGRDERTDHIGRGRVEGL